MLEYSKTNWKIIFEQKTSTAVISEVDVLMSRKARQKKHVPYGELVGTAYCLTL